MNDAISLYWSLGGLFFDYLNTITFMGVSVLCYILGAFIVSKVISALLSVARSVRLGGRSHSASVPNYNIKKEG